MMDQESLDQQIREYYGATYSEATRLQGQHASGIVELQRVRDIIEATFPAGARVADIGGATGVHAAWMAARGWQVTLVDPEPEQVEAAAALGAFPALVGDARDLPFDDGSFDAVLMLGPLYHLRSAAGRLRSLTEARRVLTAGGVVVAGGISRTAAAQYELLAPADSAHGAQALDRLIRTGNPGDIGAGSFPVGHFHTAAELGSELLEAGFVDVATRGVEGPIATGLEYLPPSDDVVEVAMVIAQAADGQPVITDLSPHIVAIGRRGAD